MVEIPFTDEGALAQLLANAIYFDRASPRETRTAMIELRAELTQKCQHKFDDFSQVNLHRRESRSSPRYRPT